jgi:hypothetical protein
VIDGCGGALAAGSGRRLEIARSRRFAGGPIRLANVRLASLVAANEGIPSLPTLARLK